MTSPFDSSIPEKYALPPVPEVYGTDPNVSVLDAYRIAAAKSVAEACGLEVGRVYEGVDIMKKQGDFYVALPRFRLGGKPDVWAKKVVDEVSSRVEE
jgi:arginyl-tRNA synthetase